MRKFITGLAVALTLSACESDAERALRHDQLCQSYGAKQGSPEYVNCRAVIHLTEYNQDQIDSANAAAGFALGYSSVAVSQSIMNSGK